MADACRERLIRTPGELADFRATQLTVGALQAALNVTGALLVALTVGVGKTMLLDRFVEHHRRADSYDLVVYLTSRRAIIDERPWVQAMDGMSRAAKRHHDVVVRHGRPRRRCGALDEAWGRLESAGCGLLGRKQLCPMCLARRGCDWPEQLSTEFLRGKRVIAATQAELAVVPTFAMQMKIKTGAERVAVILDEAAILDVKLRATISLAVIGRSLAVFQEVLRQAPRGRRVLQKWVEAHRLLLDPAVDLGGLRALPLLGGELASRLQEEGLARCGAGFHFLGYELASLAFCRRWRTDGVIQYIRRPMLKGTDFIIAAADVPLALARHRLGAPDLQAFCPGYRFAGEGSEIYNIRARLGAARNFRRNSPQILFTTAQLIAKLAAQGKRTVVVSKKMFAGEVAVLLQADLRALTGRAYRVVVSPAAKQVANPLVVPVITYGAQGINTFQGFDAAVAVNSYNARVDVIEHYVNETHQPGEEVPVEVLQVGATRIARARGYWHGRQGFSGLVQDYQAHHEAAWAVQALGRVRFATMPRTVVFFQTGPLPLPLTREFVSLDGFRKHLGLTTRREWEANNTATSVGTMAGRGMTPLQIAAALHVSVRTVQRRLRKAGDTNPY